jgi:hypothetical protein
MRTSQILGEEGYLQGVVATPTSPRKPTRKSAKSWPSRVPWATF